MLLINASIFPSNEKSSKWHYWDKCVSGPGRWADIGVAGARLVTITLTNSVASLCNVLSIQWTGNNHNTRRQATGRENSLNIEDRGCGVHLTFLEEGFHQEVKHIKE